MGLKNSDYDAIMRNYNAKQFRNKYEQDKHIEEIYEKIPEIKDIDNSISSISVSHAKRMLLDDDNTSISSLRDELNVLSKKRIKLLESHGYSEDYTRMHYECELCQDTGYINNKKCSCFKRAAIDLLYTQSNIKDMLEEENFAAFNLNYYSTASDGNNPSPRENMERVVGFCHRFIQEFDSSYQNIFFSGNTGVGKTFLTNCIAKELIDKSYSVIYFTATQLFEVFEKTTFSRDDDEDAKSMYSYILDCDLLIIDDLGTELINDFTKSKLFFCINERHLRKRSTIISTNFSLGHIMNLYSERIFSRLSSNFVMVKLYGDDIRKKKNLMR